MCLSPMLLTSINLQNCVEMSWHCSTIRYISSHHDCVKAIIAITNKCPCSVTKTTPPTSSGEPPQSDTRPCGPLNSALPHSSRLLLSPMRIWQPPVPRDAKGILRRRADWPRIVRHYPTLTNASKYSTEGISGQERSNCCCSFLF